MQITKIIEILKKMEWKKIRKYKIRKIHLERHFRQDAHNPRGLTFSPGS
jgi:hypothetical protein